MKNQRKRKMPKIKYLDYSCQIGERVYWNTIIGKKFEGKILEWDSNVAIVELDDGTKEHVEC